MGFKYANYNWDQLEQGFPSNHLGYYYEIGDEKIMEYLQLFNENKVIAVLDIDSERLATFDEIDKGWLEKIVKLIEKKY